MRRPQMGQSMTRLSPGQSQAGWGFSWDFGLGREPINFGGAADVCFGAHSGLKSDIAPCPKSANRVTSHRRKFAIGHP